MTLERLKPRLLEKVWGSSHLEPWFPNTGAKVGEVWFEGAFEGAAFEGAAFEGAMDLPLLVKFIFTTENLSVQVHPEDAYAARHHQGSRGKTEMWHILAAQPGAKIAAGFRAPLSAEHLRAAALSGEIEELLEWHPAAAGDTFFIPAGTVHTIGAGLVLCEIQQNSDVTYRLYDYGRPRELHLDHAIAVARREPAAVRQKPGEVLASCPYFTVTRDHVPPNRGFQLLIAIAGEGSIDGTPVRAGEVLYAPPGTGPLGIEGPLTLLTASE